MYMGVDAIDGGVVKLGGELWIEKPDDCSAIRKAPKPRVVRVKGVSLIMEGMSEKCTNQNSVCIPQLFVKTNSIILKLRSLEFYM